MRINPTTAANRAYLASCFQHFAQIPLRGTSDMLGTSCEIVGFKREKYAKK